MISFKQQMFFQLLNKLNTYVLFSFQTPRGRSCFIHLLLQPQDQQQSRILLLAWRELGELAYRTMVVNLLSKLEAISLFWHKLDLNSVIIGNLIMSMKEK